MLFCSSILIWVQWTIILERYFPTLRRCGDPRRIDPVVDLEFPDDLFPSHPDSSSGWLTVVARLDDVHGTTCALWDLDVLRCVETSSGFCQMPVSHLEMRRMTQIQISPFYSQFRCLCNWRGERFTAKHSVQKKNATSTKCTHIQVHLWKVNTGKDGMHLYITRFPNKLLLQPEINFSLCMTSSPCEWHHFLSTYLVLWQQVKNTIC